MLRDKRVWWAGALVVALVAAIAVSSPVGTAAEKHEMEMGKANHFKCYQVLDWGEWEPKRVELKDQFGGSVAKVIEPRMLCNPVDKNGEGVPAPNSHLVCYEIQDDPQGNTPRVKEVDVNNQFQQGPLWVGSAPVLCVPSIKRYEPRE